MVAKEKAPAAGNGGALGSVDQFAADRLRGTAEPSAPASSSLCTDHDEVSEQRLRHLAEQVHELGPAPLYHLLRDLQCGADFVSTLEAYAVLPADFIRELGGARYAAPLHSMDGGRA